MDVVSGSCLPGVIIESDIQHSNRELVVFQAQRDIIPNPHSFYLPIFHLSATREREHIVAPLSKVA
jgi:hypothetical protein